MIGYDCCRFGQLLQIGSGLPRSCWRKTKWRLRPSGRDRLAAFLPRIVPMNRAVSPSPGPSDRLLPVGEGKSVRPPAAGSWVGDQVAAVNDTDSCSTGVTRIFLT